MQDPKETDTTAGRQHVPNDAASEKTDAPLPKHNPFEDKKDHLTKEEQDAIEQFKEAQTERD
jgi:hypothetical protein